MSVFEIINPEGLDRAHGYSHGLLAPPGGRLLFVAGQTAADEDGAVAELAFGAQFERALVKMLAVVRAAGGQPGHIGRITVYVVSMDDYRASRRELGVVWRREMGRHYPAMAVVEVKGLLSPAATVEIEATAVLP